MRNFCTKEFKDKSVWYGVAGYVVAMGTGTGILSTKISYLLYPYLKQKIFHGNVQDMIVSPGYQKWQN
ncbi:hypothetical protein [Pedobacter ginsengisoli]|uniref:hypothetical protein n=1 Tax=Pedobacter ginsengisoli TaxID=363852 RepID=UPI0032B75737